MDAQAGADARGINLNQRTAASIVDGPKRGRGRPPRSRDAGTWWPVYVATYRATGSAYLAAEAAGVSVPTARRYRLEDPARQREIRHARRYFAESMEYELVKQSRGESKGSFLATVARLKATHRRMLERYSEKVADTRVLNLQVNHYGLPAALPDPRAFLADCLADATPATRALLGAVSATPIEDAVIVAGETPENQETP